MNNDISINIEEIKNLPDNSITDPETIRQISLWGIKNNSDELYCKIKKGFEFAGLYPNIMKPYNILNNLKDYFDTTPIEQIKKDWDELEEYDNIGPTVEEFLEETRKMNLNKPK